MIILNIQYTDLRLLINMNIYIDIDISIELIFFHFVNFKIKTIKYEQNYEN